MGDNVKIQLSEGFENFFKAGYFFHRMAKYKN